MKAQQLFIIPFSNSFSRLTSNYYYTRMHELNPLIQ